MIEDDEPKTIELICRRMKFVTYEKKIAYCGVNQGILESYDLPKRDCMYKDGNKCMSLDYRIR